MPETKFILESFDEHDQYVPHLFIFKNETAIMLEEAEILELKSKLYQLGFKNEE